MKIVSYLAFCVVACGAFAGEVFEHGIYDAVPLDGAWEMAYRPYAHESVDYPRFEGVKVEGAVPGYWEDMLDAFRAAGMKDEFRNNPLYGRQRLPITGWADDTTLPNISGCFYYRRTVELDRTDAAVLAFEGNLLDLFEPGFSPAFFPAFIDNSAFPHDWFDRTSACARECSECGYCEQTLQLVAKSFFKEAKGK